MQLRLTPTHKKTPAGRHHCSKARREPSDGGGESGCVQRESEKARESERHAHAHKHTPERVRMHPCLPSCTSLPVAVWREGGADVEKIATTRVNSIAPLCLCVGMIGPD